MRRAALLFAALALAPARAHAQLGELQAGVVASWGSSALTRQGAGLVFGVAPGRLGYVGLRWMQHPAAQAAPNTVDPTIVRTTMEDFALDVAAMVPVGPVDVMAGVTAGVAHFRQRTSVSGGPWRSRWAEEMLFAPGLAVEVHLGRFAVIPEVQLNLSGTPDFQFGVAHRGVTGGVRVVWTAELRRIAR